MGNAKDHAHELIDRLPPEKLTAAVSVLESMLDPVSLALANAPIDDEPLTADEERSIAEAREWLKHNSGIPHEQVLAELGITQEELEVVVAGPPGVLLASARGLKLLNGYKR